MDMIHMYTCICNHKTNICILEGFPKTAKKKKKDYKD